jgi:hypothetical protein
MILKNHKVNEKYFKRYVRGARLSRGRNISPKKITNFNMTSNPLNISLNIQGTRKYIVNIQEEQGKNNKFLIIHDCPDFERNRFCKHIVKTLLIVDTDICETICRDKKKIKFSSEISKVKQSKKRTFEIKAEEYLKKEKYLEAINHYEMAYKEVKNENLVDKIISIAIKSSLPQYALKYIARRKKYIKQYEKSTAELINILIIKKENDEIPFSIFINALFQINTILIQMDDLYIKNLLNQVKISKIRDPLFVFIMLHKAHSMGKINIFDYCLSEIGNNIRTFNKLKQYIEKKTVQALRNSVLNIESEDIIDSYEKIVKGCAFSYPTKAKKAIQEYRASMKQIYRDALRNKHAALRNLLIANYNNDTLDQIQFHYNYRYPELLWSNAKKKKEPLYYYILEKCGLRKDNLNYMKIEDYVENFPVFLNIFNANNPLPSKINDFWMNGDYSIKNIARITSESQTGLNISLGNIEKYVLIEWDLAQKPILGSFLYQYCQGFLILEQNNPFTYEIEPFDLILCLKKPIEIKSNNIKVYRPLRRVAMKDAIRLVYRGIDYVASYTPFSLLTQLADHEIDELDAINKMHGQFEDLFFPRKESFKETFLYYLKTKIARDYNQFYLSIIKGNNYKEKLLKIIGFGRYQSIFTSRDSLKQFKTQSLKKPSLTQLKYELKKFVSRKLINIIKNGDYEQVNLTKLKKFPEFAKWTRKIILELKKELLNCTLFQNKKGLINISQLEDCYYGKKILYKSQIERIAAFNKGKRTEKHNKNKFMIKKEDLSKLYECFSYLKLKKPKLITEKSGNS